MLIDAFNERGPTPQPELARHRLRQIVLPDLNIACDLDEGIGRIMSIEDNVFDLAEVSRYVFNGKLPHNAHGNPARTVIEEDGVDGLAHALLPRTERNIGGRRDEACVSWP